MSDKKSLAVIGDDLDALLDTREGCEDPAMLTQIDAAIAAASQNLEKKVDATAYVLSKWKSEATRYDAEADRLYGKAQAYNKRIDWLEGLVLQFLKDHEQTELAGEFNSFVIAKNPPALHILDEEMIPAKYVEVIPATMRIQKDEIKAALKLGIKIAGAELTQGERLKRK